MILIPHIYDPSTGTNIWYTTPWIVVNGLDPLSTTLDLKLAITDAGQTYSSFCRVNDSDWNLLDEYSLDPSLGTLYGMGSNVNLPVIGIGETPNPPVTTSVPEPTTLLLLGTGLIGFAGFRKKFKKV